MAAPKSLIINSPYAAPVQHWQQAIPVVIDSRDEETGERSVRAVRHAAKDVDADFIFVIMEAWSLEKAQLHRRQEIIERYGSIGAGPCKIAVVSFSLETRHGIWTAQALGASAEAAHLRGRELHAR